MNGSSSPKAWLLTLSWLALLAALGCGGEELAPERASGGGLVEARSGSQLAGFINIKRRNGALKLFLNVLNAPPGEHAVRLHQAGDCSAFDATSAGAVWAPEGSPLGDASVLGDLGNLRVDPQGRGLLSLSSAGWGLGDGSELDLVGRALVIHERPGELLAASNDADVRLGCGVIR
jgi:Cu-Zn family superoxide dismutase